MTALAQVEEKDDRVFVKVALLVRRGEVEVLLDGREYGESLRLSTKRAVKLARVLGVEATMREAIERQARDAMEEAERTRGAALDSLRDRLEGATRQDAAARRALEALDVAS